MKVQSIYRKHGDPALLKQAYDRTVSQWTVPVESLFVETRYGRTHILASGPVDGEPLILFHGFAFSSTMWLENVEVLAEHYRVYAVDFMGDINLSVMHFPIHTERDCVEWFEEVLNGLQVARANLGGHSYGGFIAMLLASRMPERVGKLLVLSPGATLQPQRKAFFFRCLMVGLFPSTRHLEAFMSYMTGKGNQVAQVLKDQFIVAMQQALPRNRLFAVNMRDEQLQRIQAPTLLLIGDQDIQYDANAAVRRAERVIPNIEAHVVPNTGHGLPLERPDIVNRCILAFLMR